MQARTKNYLTLNLTPHCSQQFQRNNNFNNIFIISKVLDGETVEIVSDLFLGAPKSLQMVTAAMELKDAYSLEEKL